MKLKDLTKTAIVAYIVSILAYILDSIIEIIYNISPMKLELNEYISGLLYMPVFIFPYMFAMGLLISLLVNKIVKNSFIKLFIYFFSICTLSYILVPMIPILKLIHIKIVFSICMLIFVLLIDKFAIFK